MYINYEHITNTFYLDSLIIARPKTTPLPLEISSSIFGKYKQEILEPIEVFYSLGPKNYCIKTRKEVQIKCRGFFLKNAKNEKAINENTYKEFIEALINEEETLREVVPQFKISFNKNNGQLYSHLQLKSFCSNVFQKRILLKTSDESSKPLTYSVPFGYDNYLIQKVVSICK